MDRVLIVEDDPATAGMLAAVVNIAGKVPVVAKDLDEACDRLEEGMKDFILVTLDGTVPASQNPERPKTTAELAGLLRQRGFARNIVALTGDGKALMDLETAGCNLGTVKPFDIMKLRDLVVSL